VAILYTILTLTLTLTLTPGGYSIHYTNTNPNLYPGANPG